MPVDHRQWLVEQVKRHGWQRGCELGVKAGDTLRLLVTQCPGIHMIGVDDWRDCGEWDQQDNKHHAYNLAFAYPNQIHILEMDTINAAEYVDDYSLDFVFIDADHSTNAVIADIEAWRGKVRPGGMLCGDDATKESVRAALDYCVPGWKRDGRCWYSGPQ